MKKYILWTLCIVSTYLHSCHGCANTKGKSQVRTSKNTTKATEQRNKLDYYVQPDIALKTYKVVGVVDGDTFDVFDIEKKSASRIRMNGIDAPERGMPYNKKAKQYLSNLIFGKEVVLQFLDEDRNGRLIAKTIINDNVDVSLEMIKAGYAWHFKEFSDDELYAYWETVAKQNKIGLWQESNPLSPWEVRKMHRSGISTKKLFENSPK
jgi:micrococcal nuclease